MCCHRTLGVMMGFGLLVGVWSPGTCQAQEKERPPHEAAPADPDPPLLAGPETEPAPWPSLETPPPGGPLPPPPRPAEGGRPSERRLFGRHHPRPTYQSMPEEERVRLEEFMRKHLPELFEELARLDEDAPEVFARTVNRLLPQLLRLMQLEHEDPETFPLQVAEFRISTQIRALARRISRDRGQDRHPKLVAELRRLLEKRFDVRQQLHRTEVERLARRLAEARERLDRLAADKEKIIAQELEETLAPPLPEPKKDRPRYESPVGAPGEAS